MKHEKNMSNQVVKYHCQISGQTNCHLDWRGGTLCRPSMRTLVERAIQNGFIRVDIDVQQLAVNTFIFNPSQFSKAAVKLFNVVYRIKSLISQRSYSDT